MHAVHAHILGTKFKWKPNTMHWRNKDMHVEDVTYLQAVQFCVICIGENLAKRSLIKLTNLTGSSSENWSQRRPEARHKTLQIIRSYYLNTNSKYVHNTNSTFIIRSWRWKFLLWLCAPMVWEIYVAMVQHYNATQGHGAVLSSISLHSAGMQCML